MCDTKKVWFLTPFRLKLVTDFHFSRLESGKVLDSMELAMF